MACNTLLLFAPLWVRRKTRTLYAGGLHTIQDTDSVLSLQGITSVCGWDTVAVVSAPTRLHDLAERSA